MRLPAPLLHFNTCSPHCALKLMFPARTVSNPTLALRAMWIPGPCGHTFAPSYVLGRLSCSRNGCKASRQRVSYEESSPFFLSERLPDCVLILCRYCYSVCGLLLSLSPLLARQSSLGTQLNQEGKTCRYALATSESTPRCRTH